MSSGSRLGFFGEQAESVGWMGVTDGSDRFTIVTLPKTNIAPTNGWLEYYFPIGEAYFQGLR